MEQTKDSSKKKSNSWIKYLIIGFAFLCIIASCIVAFIMSFGVVGGAISDVVNAEGDPEVQVLRNGTGDKIAVVNMSGIIVGNSTETGNPVSGEITPYQVKQVFNRLKDDNSVEAVVLKIESPGGSVVASDIIYREVLELKEEKEVYVYSENLIASGGYYIAVASDEIYLHPEALTGSIGVILQLQSLEGLYEKLGIETRTFKSGEYKDNEEVFDGEDNAQEIYQDIVDESYDRFVEKVVDGRDLSESRVRTLADGRIYSATDAVNNDLVDDVYYFEEFLGYVAEDIGEDDPYIYIEELYELSFLDSLLSETDLGLPVNRQDENTPVQLHYLYTF